MNEYRDAFTNDLQPQRHVNEDLDIIDLSQEDMKSQLKIGRKSIISSKSKKNKLSVLKKNAPNRGTNKRQRDYAE